MFPPLEDVISTALLIGKAIGRCLAEPALFTGEEWPNLWGMCAPEQESSGPELA